MIRYFYLNLFIGLYTILFSAWGVLLSLFGNNGSRIHFSVAVPWARGVLRVCGVKVVVDGLENIKPGVSYIYMSNHQSAFDIFTLLGYLPADFKFILKKELMKIPIFGRAMKKAGYIAIDRGDPREAIKSMNRAAEKIRRGTSILIFPEGTRSKDGRLQDFKKGGFHLAIKSGCDIVPLVIPNSRNIVQKGSMRIHAGTITMKICKPVVVKDYAKRDLERLMGRVRETMKTVLE